MPTTFPRSLKDNDWKILVDQIQDGECVPFLGPGVSPVQYDSLIEKWAAECGVTVGSRCDLARIGQYMTMSSDQSLPKREIGKFLKKHSISANQQYAYLAGLPFRLYATTNFDDAMLLALQNRPEKDKKPQRDLCYWNEPVNKLISRLSPGFVPSIAEPLVYHLYGYGEEPTSLVLTEDDYLDFLSKFSREDVSDAKDPVIDLRVSRILSKSSWLLLGYRLEDWDFRVLLRVLDQVRRVNKNTHISVQLHPLGTTAAAEQVEKAITYLDVWFKGKEVRVFWGTVEEFISDLRSKLT